MIRSIPSRLISITSTSNSSITSTTTATSRRLTLISKHLSTMSLPIPPSSTSTSVAPSPSPSPAPASSTTSTTSTTSTILPSTTPKQLNILFLHGYTQSGPRFQAKTNALTKFLKKSFQKHGISVNCVFPTAPQELRTEDVPQFSTSSDGGSVIEMEDSWAWWRRDDATGEYKYLKECWAFLSDVLNTSGPFHFVIGFSQGGALAALLASALESTPSSSTSSKQQQRVRPEGFNTTHPPLYGCISYCGFRAPPSAGLENLYIPKITARVLHVLGSLDTVVSEERSMGLVDACEGGRERNLVWHPGGHYVVIQRPYLEKVVGFMIGCIKDAVENGDDEGVKKEDEEEEEDVNDMDVPF